MTVLVESLYKSILQPVFLYEITASDGSVSTPAYKPLTLGRYTLGTLPYRSASTGETTFFFSDADWTEIQSIPADLTLDFTEAMPGGLTFTRSGTAWGWDSSGTFRSYGNNVPRVAQTDERGVPQGILLEGARTNAVDHSDAGGAVVGVVGGTGSLPSNWYSEWSANTLWTVVGTGTDKGMPYIDLNISGLGSTSTPMIIQLVGFDAVPAASGQTWTGSVFVKRVGGSLNNVNNVTCRVSGFNTVSRLQTEFSETVFDLIDGGFVRGKHTRTLNSASTDAASVELCMDVDLGVPLDITLRISIPQLEQGRFASSPILTNGGAVTRNGDVCYLATSGTWFDAAVNTIAAEISVDSVSSFTGFGRSVYSLDDNTANNLCIGSIFGQGSRVLAYNATVQIVNIGGDTIQPSVNHKTASRFRTNDYRFRTSAGAASFTDTSGTIPTVNQLCIGSYARGNEPLYGYFNKLFVWKSLNNNSLLDATPTNKTLPPLWGSPLSARQNVHYEGRCDTLNMDKSLPLTPESQNRSVISIGDIRINNTDGYFDSLVKTYAVDGRAISVKLLASASDQYADAIPAFSGIGVDWVADKESLTLQVRESSFYLDVPMLSLFGGTGSGDGTSANIGHAIPQAYGLCRNIVAELVDPAKLIYRFHDRVASDVLAVYDRGAPVTKANSYSTYSALSGAVTVAGTFDYALTSTGSYYRLGSAPSGTVTADVRGDALGSYVGTTGAILQRIMLRGTVIGSIDTASLADIDAALTGEVGIYFNQQINISNALDQVTSGTFTFWGDIGNGLIGGYVLSDPSGVTPDWELSEYAIQGEVEPAALPDSIGPTVWRRRIGYKINWTPLTGTDIVPAPTITEARRKELQDPYQIVSVGDSARLIKNILAIDAPTLVTLFDSSTDATALANRLLTLYAPGRQIFSVPVSLAGYQMMLNDVILLTWPRFGLSGGVLVRIVGINYKGDTVVLTVFG